MPKTLGIKPLVVYIPGGGFVLADRTANLNQRTYVAEQGYVVVSITYRTVLNGATWRDSLVDVKSAIRYLRAHADQYCINVDEVAVWGQSAGGYLAASSDPLIFPSSPQTTTRRHSRPNTHQGTR